jgi:spore germination protein KB
LGVYRASHLIYPLYNIAEELRAAPFIEHVESAIAIVWLTSLFLKLSIAFYCSTTALCDLFVLKDRSRIALPLVFLVSGLAVTLLENNVVNAQWDKQYTFTYFSLFGVVLPVVLLVWTGVRNRFISSQREGAS